MISLVFCALTEMKKSQKLTRVSLPMPLFRLQVTISFFTRTKSHKKVCAQKTFFIFRCCFLALNKVETDLRSSVSGARLSCDVTTAAVKKCKQNRKIRDSTEMNFRNRLPRIRFPRKVRNNQNFVFASWVTVIQILNYHCENSANS